MVCPFGKVATSIRESGYIVINPIFISSWLNCLCLFKQVEGCSTALVSDLLFVLTIFISGKLEEN